MPRHALRHGVELTDPRLDVLCAELHGLPATWSVVAECGRVNDDMIELKRMLREVGSKVYAGAVPPFP